jgi:phosphomannomutase
MVIFARDVLARNPGAAIIADVKASSVFFDEVARAGGEPVMWKTGHSLIKARMAEIGAPLAGEMSGHIFFADGYFGFDDGLYAAIRLLSILGRAEHGLAHMLDALPRMVNTPELRFPCEEARKFAVVDEVKSRLARRGRRMFDLDGVRVEGDDGWWLLRASNTQAVLVARCEAETEAGLRRLKSELAAELQAVGLQPPDFG